MDLATALGRNFLFRALTPEQRAQLAGYVSPRWFKTGEIVFSQGDPGDAMYLIRSGSFSVERDGAELARLEAGHHFGEMALIDGYPRSATVRALGQSEVLAISREAFADATHKIPNAAAPIYRNFTWYLTQRLRLTSETAAHYKSLAESSLEISE